MGITSDLLSWELSTLSYKMAHFDKVMALLVAFAAVAYCAPAQEESLSDESEGQTKGWGAPFGAAVAGVVAPALAAPVAHAVASVAHAVAPVAHAVGPAVAVARPWGAAYGYGVAHP